MAIIKCKMCGGDLNIIEGQSVCECEYCGTRQTVPMLDNEKKMNLFARANRLRFNSEFDKASGIYESIIADAPEEAEAYWGLVLCKYGIEYVDDPATGKKIPTCHRSSFDSVMQDSDFDLACEYADPIARKVYQQEVKQIEEIRKGILEVSNKEEPYDIFICYKESDKNGNRTLDSVLAQDIYDALTDKGYRVFFARISLEDKLGQEYEPYIFAALNSAKIMLAVGTDYEYFNAVWVKNEWSRYLKLMAKDKDKHLIPCYKNLDAYDIPQEFVKLQAQDLGKVGAIQDLLRGIEKLLGNGNFIACETRNGQDIIVKAEIPSVESLLKRADIFLKDSDWSSAKDYYNRVLDIEPECAEAYLGINLANFKYLTMNQAAENRKIDFFETNDFKRSEYFAKNELNNKIHHVKRTLNTILKEDNQKELEKRIQKERIFKFVSDCFISASNHYSVGLKVDGTVLLTRYTDKSISRNGQNAVGKWRDIVAISAGRYHMIGLQYNGMVVASGEPWDGCGQYGVQKWRDIVAVSAGRFHTVGVQSNGNVVAVGGNSKHECDVSEWRNIVAISAGDYHTVGVCNNGNVVATGVNDQNQCDVQEWRNIVAVSAGYNHTVGLDDNGSVLATGNNSQGKCNVSKWSDIVSISAGAWHTVGLRRDGTVVAVGDNEYNQCNVSSWKDIVAISAGSYHTLGLQSDGIVVSTEYIGREKNNCGQCSVENWRLFSNIESIEQDQQAFHNQFIIEKERRAKGVCPYCGGTFKGLVFKKCTQCGKTKDY